MLITWTPSVSPLTARTYYAPMQHAWQSHVLDIAVSALGFQGYIISGIGSCNDGVGRWVFEWGIACKRLVEKLIADELAIGHGPGRDIKGRDKPVADKKTLSRAPELNRGHLE